MAGNPTVLVAGAINTDLVGWCDRAPGAGETVTGSRFAVFGGGKGANQAVSAARSGATTTMLGAVGQDDFGRERLRDLHAEGIAVGNVAVVDGMASGVALISVETGGENRILYVPGATQTVSAEQAAAAVSAPPPVVILMTLELPLAALLALQRVARSSGARVLLNATPEPEGGRSLLGDVDVLIVNETEALALLDDRTLGEDWAAMARALGALGPQSVVITIGEDGAVLFHDDRVESLPSPRVEVVDTTGAGDAFCGALAARLAAGSDLRAATRAGVLAGALAVTKAGAQPSMPTATEIDALAARS